MKFVMGLAAALLIGTAAMAQSGGGTAATGSNASGVQPSGSMGSSAAGRSGGMTKSKKMRSHKKRM